MIVGLVMVFEGVVGGPDCEYLELGVVFINAP